MVPRKMGTKNWSSNPVPESFIGSGNSVETMKAYRTAISMLQGLTSAHSLRKDRSKIEKHLTGPTFTRTSPIAKEQEERIL
ncbi:MAG: hypothetical protein OK474_05390 [Thaumarchaeota archaeon]|nr:hypothetical protein [Nitrososphaerota archaeon]